MPDTHIYFDAVTGEEIVEPVTRGKDYFVGPQAIRIRFDYVDNVLVLNDVYYHFITMQFVPGG